MREENAEAHAMKIISKKINGINNQSMANKSKLICVSFFFILSANGNQ